ncbi:MAG: D-alanyl-D-alanine carboxypeptidase family protein [Ruminococcus sp.]|nr:D-alanyl-D-alanine carboxypeptidase family protein [Ruminococcus sp.]
MESRNMTEKEFEEFQQLLARELGAIDPDRDKEEEVITEMLRHEGAAHEAAKTAGSALRELAARRAAEERAFTVREETEKNMQYNANAADTVNIDEMLRHEAEPEAAVSVQETASKVIRGKYEKVVEEPVIPSEPEAPKASGILKKPGKYEKVTEEQEGYFNPETPKETAAQRRRRAKKNTKILRIAIGLSAVFIVGLSAGLIVNTIKANNNKPQPDRPVSAVQTDANGNVIDSGKAGECSIISITPLNTYTAVIVGKTVPVQISMATTGTVDAGDLLWTSSDTSIASVDEDGIIKGISAGTCDITISAKADPSVSASMSCTVRKMEKKNGVTYVDGILLINKSYGADASFDPGDLTEETQNAFNDLCAAAAKEDLTIYYASGYRSHDEQVEIYNDYIDVYGAEMADTFSARPGFSEHQSALVIDVNSIDDTFDDTPEAKWLEKHCAEFGFIIRYPKGKEHITGYKYESWHIRYVGKEIAKEVTRLGITLDEYLGVDSVYANDYVKEQETEPSTEAETEEATEDGDTAE